MTCKYRQSNHALGFALRVVRRLRSASIVHSRAAQPMTSDHDADVESVATAIEAYLTAHPNAADALDGVVTWWLAAVPRAVSRGVVERALERLIAAGTVERRRTEGGAVIFGRTKKQ